MWMHRRQRQLGGNDLGVQKCLDYGRCFVLCECWAEWQGRRDSSGGRVQLFLALFLFSFFFCFLNNFFSQLLRNSRVAHVAVKFHGT